MARLPKSIIKKYGITKKAWRIFKGQKRKRPTRRTRRKANPDRKRGVKRMPKNKRRGGGKSLTRTAFKFIRLGALVANPIRIAMLPIKPEDKVAGIMLDFTGYDISTGQFHPEALARGWGPYLMACLATYGIPKLTSIIRRI